MARTSMGARLVRYRAGDFQHLECIKSKTAMMTLWVSKTGDSICNRLVEGFAGGGDLDDVLMMVMFRHGMLPICVIRTEATSH